MLTGGADLGAVVQLLLSECDVGGFVRLLSCGNGDVARAAAVCLGLKGSLGECRVLAGLLANGDAALMRVAENSLWQIWMRAGSDWGNCRLTEAVEHIRYERYESALGVLDELIGSEPSFAEAHHQRGIALWFLERLREAGQAFWRAWRENPYHYSAAVNLAHVYTESGNLKRALFHYRNALRIHPGLDEIPGVVKRLEVAVGRGSA